MLKVIITVTHAQRLMLQKMTAGKQQHLQIYYCLIGIKHPAWHRHLTPLKLVTKPPQTCEELGFQHSHLETQLRSLWQKARYLYVMLTAQEIRQQPCLEHRTKECWTGSTRTAQHTGFVCTISPSWN